MPAKPKADGSIPNSACPSGCFRPLVPSLTGAAAGMNGVRLDRCTKNAPATMTNRQIATLMTTRTLVTRALSRMPTRATSPSTSTMKIAPTLTIDPSPKIEDGRPNSSCR